MWLTGPLTNYCDENGRGCVVFDYVNWCDESYVLMNVIKIKELSIDFRKKSAQPQPSIICNKTVESVNFRLTFEITYHSLNNSTGCDISEGRRRSHIARGDLEKRGCA